MAIELQMIRDKSSFSNKINLQKRPIGLLNLGNSCYLNSVLQCLTYTPPLANLCLKSDHSEGHSHFATEIDRNNNCAFCILEARISRSLCFASSPDNPEKFQSCIRIFADHFRLGEQEDAHEFLRYVIEACNRSCLHLKKLQHKNNGGESSHDGNTVVKEIFGGALQSQVKCRFCGISSYKVDEMMDISVDVKHIDSLNVALQKYFQTEELDGSNKYKCEKCKRLVQAEKKMSILQAPNVLVIHFKRFEGMPPRKIDNAMAFEEALLLSRFMCEDSQDLNPNYKLFGTIVHSGLTPDSGHYYAYVKDATERWFRCNDNHVTLSSLQTVLSEKAYILFFLRTNQRSPTPGQMLSSNGVKSHSCNGNGTANSVKVAHQTKEVKKKPLVEKSFVKNVSTISKVERVQMKFSLGTSGSKRVTATSNGKLDGHNHKNEFTFKNGEVNGKVNGEVNGEVNGIVHSQESGCNMKFDAHKVQNTVKNGNEKSAILAEDNNTNAEIHSIINNINHHYPSGGGYAPIDSSGEGIKPEDKELQNSGVHFHSNNSGSKRKLNFNTHCILFPQSPDSQASVQAFKAELQLEASLVLQSCGWSDKVFSFMQSRKRLCAKVSNIESNENELKKMLIAEAKKNFLSQVPESLKGDLIERLKSFSQKKATSGSSKR